jgi:hypothetical protein
MKPDLIIYGRWLLAALAAANFIYQATKNRGLEGAVFGAPITGTVGEPDLGKFGPMHTRLKLHHLEPRETGAPTVGIEVVNRSIASYHMFPIRLTSEQAAALRELLSQTMARG